MTSDLQQRFKKYAWALENDQKARDTAFSIDKRTTQLAKKMVFAVHRHDNTTHLENEILREFSRIPTASRFRYGYLLSNARQEYLEALLLQEFVRQVEDNHKGGAEVTLEGIIRGIHANNSDNNNNNNNNDDDTASKCRENERLAERLGNDDRAEVNLLLALLDFSGELARLGTIETARYGKPALAVAQTLLYHVREIADYVGHDAGMRGFYKKLEILALSVGKLERILTFACLAAETGPRMAAGGSNRDSASFISSSEQISLKSGKRTFSMVQSPYHFEDHSL